MVGVVGAPPAESTQQGTRSNRRFVCPRVATLVASLIASSKMAWTWYQRSVGFSAYAIRCGGAGLLRGLRAAARGSHGNRDRDDGNNDDSNDQRSRTCAAVGTDFPTHAATPVSNAR